MIVKTEFESFKCTRAVRGPDYITLYDDVGMEFMSFQGISDFSGYAIEGGDWSDPEPDVSAFLAGLMEGYDG